MKHQHLTAAVRGAIEGLLLKQYSIREIARTLGLPPSTVSREISKRGTPSGYYARIAQEHYERIRTRCKQKKKLNHSKRQKYLVDKLIAGWSPEQISGRLKAEGRNDLYVCPETIYQFLYTDDWAKEESLSQYLRYGRKRRKKQKGRSVHCAKIPNRVSIHKRPPVVVKRKEYGHCETDSVIYLNKMAVNTINELVTGKVAFTKLARKTAELTAKAQIQIAQRFGVKSYTADNGSEHTAHETVSAQTGVPFYFADPYASYQRGANENCNMLLRGYLPKKADISNVTQQDLDDIAEELNNRPRKRLGYLTPNEKYQLLHGGSSVALDFRM